MTTVNKKIQIQEIIDGQTIHDLFLVREMSRGETKAGKPYLSLVLMDASGEISCRVWENAEQLMDECPAGAIVSVTGQAQGYRGILQLRIDTLSRVQESEVDLALFVPSTKGNIGLMAKELLKLVNSVENPFLKELLLSLFGERRLMQSFKKAPAAKMMHHAYVGGLLEHTLAVARLAESISTLYPTLDRSLLIAGALLHDIGKLREFSFDSFPFDYTDRGRLVGHMVLGIEMMQEKINAISGFPEDLGDRLKHLILSHHGRHEFGSPSLPMMQEAFALNFLDDLDAKINYLDRLSGQVKGEGYQWTEFQRNLERFLFVRGHQAEDGLPADQGQDNGVDPRQRTLFGL
ncbi:3'-5' exoribonuclease YhaM family protein [Thiovibrio frasassiensis]|uniref:HD domain-containing protein n=1 Tax=Thiovibrio frasassiensis TaxID=2984131 RepID=A0A9X4MG46_9BACT|nr:HD domain-containing protein [Thiovibrio frasassiensis]MDG4475721.1 HD domain-containing protein [Thiovibrio frasassiensis]